MLCFKSHYGNRGFVLSLDAVIAVILVFVLMTTLAISLQNKENLQNIYLSKRGSDIAALIDSNSRIDSLNITLIKNEVVNLTDFEDIEMNITTYNPDLSGKSSISFSTASPKNSSFVSTGKRFFVIMNNTRAAKFGVINYRIWKK